MKIKLKDVLVAKDGMTKIGEGKVIAIGETSVVVRVTKSADGGANVGDLYEVWNDWFEGEHAFYEIKGDFFKVGSVYKYSGNIWSDAKARYEVVKLIHLDNPDSNDDTDVAVVISTDGGGRQWVENFNKADFCDFEIA